VSHRDAPTLALGTASSLASVLLVAPPLAPSRKTVRTLVAEDSPTARELLVSVLQQDPHIEVAGVAEDGHQAVSLVKQLRPDVVTMDIQMPHMDGLEATKRIMAHSPTPIVIVSATNVADVRVSMNALRAGALTLLPKPVGPHHADFEKHADRLRWTVRAMAQVMVVRRWPSMMRIPVAPVLEQMQQEQQADTDSALAPETGAVPRIVGLACSTGGPTALAEILSNLPRSFPLPIAAVQHLAPGFIGSVATWLQGHCPLQVSVAHEGMTLQIGHVYLAPDEHHLEVRADQTLRLSRDPPIRGFRPSASALFQSLASTFGPSAVGCVLSGMGDDGVEGLRALRARGGRVIAQDEASSVVYGMACAAVTAGLADDVLPLKSIAARLRSLASC
jgi:two-component system chemotaxis response regulator CheB